MEHGRLQACQQCLNFKLARLQRRKHLLTKRKGRHNGPAQELEQFQQLCVDEREISHQLRWIKSRLHRLKRRANQIRSFGTIYSFNIDIFIEFSIINNILNIVILLLFPY